MCLHRGQSSWKLSFVLEEHRNRLISLLVEYPALRYTWPNFKTVSTQGMCKMINSGPNCGPDCASWTVDRRAGRFCLRFLWAGATKGNVGTSFSFFWTSWCVVMHISLWYRYVGCGSLWSNISMQYMLCLCEYLFAEYVCCCEEHQPRCDATSRSSTRNQIFDITYSWLPRRPAWLILYHSTRPWTIVACWTLDWTRA